MHISQQQLLQEQVNHFQKQIWDFYRNYGRNFVWRNCDNPYHVFVSEVMLQQTQTHRVEPKFEQFIEAFSSFEMLASAQLSEVLGVWQGLGYNRRGKFLHKSAQLIITEFEGALPDDPEILVQLPGIGPATAASLAAFAYNRPTVFIETNIRSVFIHTFFSNKKTAISDQELLPLIEQTVDPHNPREWYYALMDYGVHLKKQLSNPSRRSKHHTAQSKFEGSNRQIRGKVIKLLVEKKKIKIDDLALFINDKKDRTLGIINDLIQEELISRDKSDFITIQ